MSKTFIDFLISWGPMIMLIIVWIYFIKKSGSADYRTYMGKSTKLMEEYLAEMKLINKKLDLVVSLLERDKGRK